MIFEAKSVNSIVDKNTNALFVTSNRYKKYLRKVDRHRIYNVETANIQESKKIFKIVKENNITNIISIGSGKVIDTGKYASFLANIDFVAIPACLSTNCFFTDKSTLFINNVKKTLDSTLPKKVIIDWKIIDENVLMNMFGEVELLSSITALADWEIAQTDNIEKIHKKIYSRAKSVSKKIFVKLFKNNTKLILDLLRKSGSIAVDYKTGRPVSGSEHILANIVENIFKCPHGLALSISIPIVYRLQKKIGCKHIIDDFDKLFIKNIPYKQYLKSTIDKDMLFEKLIMVSPRVDRYTVLNKVDFKTLTLVVSETLNDLFD